MSPHAGFLLSLAATLALLAGVVVTGLRAKRRQHIPLVVCAVLSLGVTIYFAERLGEIYDLSTAGWITPVHLMLAVVTTLAYLLPIATGIATLCRPAFRPWHRRAAILVLTLTALTAATGTWMLLASDRIDALPESATQ